MGSTSFIDDIVCFASIEMVQYDLWMVCVI